MLMRPQRLRIEQEPKAPGMSTLVPLSAALKVEQPETRLNNRISGHLGSLTPGGVAKIMSAWSSRLPGRWRLAWAWRRRTRIVPRA
jgi:hypothetical protein